MQKKNKNRKSTLDETEVCNFQESYLDPLTFCGITKRFNAITFNGKTNYKLQILLLIDNCQCGIY